MLKERHFCNRQYSELLTVNKQNILILLILEETIHGVYGKTETGKNRPSHSENKKQLRLALTTLMLEKNINEITVSQLTALADLNRSTFYIHYQDIYDMVEQIETEIFQQFVELVQSRTPSAQLLTDIFYFLAENADLCAAFWAGMVIINL